ncbi:unnamed protein product [Polarella glacialis]|uniref:Uncharacterized protein n=1 Tax=Polarella glacialis TaxID=89957 RepID=A0A813L0V3_POLGL|nr:unnamed protein product [Polarella glacialis]
MQGRQEQPWSAAAAEGLSCADDSDDAGCETPMSALWMKSVGWMRHFSFNFQSSTADDTPGRDGATRSAGGSLFRDPEPEGGGSGGSGSGSILGEHSGCRAVSASEADGLRDTESEHRHGTATPEWQELASPRNMPSAGSLSHQELHEKLLLQGRQEQPRSAAAAEGLSCEDDADDAQGCKTPRERALLTKSAGWVRQSGFNPRPSTAANDTPGREGATRSAGGSHLRDPEPEGRGSGGGMVQVFGWRNCSASEAVGLWHMGAHGSSDTESEQGSFDNISVVSAGWCVREDVGPFDGVRSSDSDFDNFSD